MATITVFMLPIRLDGNKYIELLVASLENRAISVKAFDKRTFYKMKRGDVLHLHWPSFNYSGNNGMKTLLKSSAFVLLLTYLRIRGIKIVWTVHNVWPHQGGPSRFNRLMRTFLCAFCSRIILMGASVKEELVRNFKATEKKMLIVPHGHYKEAYPSFGLDVRERFGIPKNAYLFAFIGQISPYKGIDRLLGSFEKLSDEGVHLLIAGKPSQDLEFSIRTAAERDMRVHLSLSFVDDSEVADYVLSSDCLVLPYRNITTSGTAILALTYSKPVIAPDIGLLREYTTPETSILYNPSEPDGLTNSMAEMMRRKTMFDNKRPYERKLEELDWTKVSELLLNAYGRQAKAE